MMCQTEWPTARQHLANKFDGPLPLEALVDYVPITAKDKSRVHQFGKKTLEEYILGHVFVAAGGWS